MSIIYSPLESLKYNEGLHSKFRINNYKTEEPEIYLCVELSKIDNNHKDEFWDMSSDKYCTAMVNNFHTTSGKTLYDIGYVALTSDTYLWMRPAMEDDSFQY